MAMFPSLRPLLAFMVLLWMVQSSATVSAQSKFEKSKTLGFTIGTGYYLGEMNPNGHFRGRFQPGFGGFMRFNMNRRFGVRAAVRTRRNGRNAFLLGRTAAVRIG